MTTTEIIYLIFFGIAVAFATFYYMRNRRIKAELIEANQTIARLWESNNERINDIEVLIRQTDSPKKTEIVSKWKFKFEGDRNMMFGIGNTYSGVSGGITPMIYFMDT